MSNSELADQCNKAIAAHSAWKAKFKKLLAGELQIDVATTRKSDVCDFGKWLATGSTRAMIGGDFATIDAAHKQFHSVAADVVAFCAAGRRGKPKKPSR